MSGAWGGVRGGETERERERDVCIRGPGALVYLPYGPHYNEEAL